jgi:hypothetical protein
MLDEFGADTLFAATALLYERVTGRHDFIAGDVYEFLEWSDLPRLKKIRKLAKRAKLMVEPLN